MNNRVFHKALITGITGSTASYLVEYILEYQPGVEVHGIARWHSTSKSNISSFGDRITVHECDLGDFPSIVNVLEKVKPDLIFHIASYANVRTSFITPISVVNNNIIGTLNLFEAIRISKIDPVIHLCSTSEVYGEVDAKDMPITEDHPMRPASPYAVSKAAQDLLGFSYWRSYKMKIITTRMFSYLNPRRDDLFSTSFAKQVAEIEIGRRKVLRHGNLDSLRAIMDIRDAVEAYWFAVERCEFGEAYNIGGGVSIKVGEFLDLLKKLAKYPIKTELDPNLLRPSDVTLQMPDATKFINATGWKPKYFFEESVQNLLDYWREKVKIIY
jgi:GDP-4-dehydro-6-deoxy-D-mannose reductase